MTYPFNVIVLYCLCEIRKEVDTKEVVIVGFFDEHIDSDNEDSKDGQLLLPALAHDHVIDDSRGYKVQSDNDDAVVLVSGCSSRKDDETDGRTDILVHDKTTPGNQHDHYSIDADGEVTKWHS